MGVAYDHGVNFFDNAEIYARGQSEIVMGEILRKKKWRRDSYVVSSKVFWGLGGKDLKPTQRGLNRKHVVEACEQALKRLQVDYLDLYFCHRPDKQTPIEETVWTMHNLIQQGKILYWGTSEWSAQEIMEAHMVAQRYSLIGPTMEQPEYSMLRREKVEVEFAQVYQTVGLGTTTWSPLASGVLTGKYNDGFPPDTRLGMDGLGWLKDASLVEANLKRAQSYGLRAGDRPQHAGDGTGVVFKKSECKHRHPRGFQAGTTCGKLCRCAGATGAYTSCDGKNRRYSSKQTQPASLLKNLTSVAVVSWVYSPHAALVCDIDVYANAFRGGRTARRRNTHEHLLRGR